jgi:hypothetical protein
MNVLGDLRVPGTSLRPLSGTGESGGAVEDAGEAVLREGPQEHVLVKAVAHVVTDLEA